MADRTEPGPSGNYGADGIPREGMEERYATALWRDNPVAFWLHPEGPLSDTTPDEYFVTSPLPTVGPWEDSAPYYSQAAYLGQMSALQNAYLYQNAIGAQYRNGTIGSPFGSLLSGLFRL